MNSRKTFIGLILIIATFFLSVGYGAIPSDKIKIISSAQATVNDANFKVKFDQGVIPTTTNAKAEVIDNRIATIAVSGLTEKGDIAKATYTIINESSDLESALSAIVTENTNSDFFLVSYSFEKEKLSAGEKTTVTVEVELLKTPVTDQTGKIEIQITAKPIQ